MKTAIVFVALLAVFGAPSAQAGSLVYHVLLNKTQDYVGRLEVLTQKNLVNFQAQSQPLFDSIKTQASDVRSKTQAILDGLTDNAKNDFAADIEKYKDIDFSSCVSSLDGAIKEFQAVRGEVNSCLEGKEGKAKKVMEIEDELVKLNKNVVGIKDTVNQLAGATNGFQMFLNGAQIEVQKLMAFKLKTLDEPAAKRTAQAALVDLKEIQGSVSNCVVAQDKLVTLNSSIKAGSAAVKSCVDKKIQEFTKKNAV